MSRSRHYVPRCRDIYDFRDKNIAAAVRADLPAALAEYEHHARWSTAPEFVTTLDYADREAIVLAQQDAKHTHHRGRRRSMAWRNSNFLSRAFASNNKGGRLEPAAPHVVYVDPDTPIQVTITIG